MKKVYNLWLDESGKFDDVNLKRHYNPSLVGGLLFEGSKFTDYEAKKIIVEDVYHANKEKNSIRNIEIVKEVMRKGGTCVVFENTGRISVVNKDITYLNVCIDGIIKLIKELTVDDSEIELNVLKAIRVETEKKKGNLIRENEYLMRLEEKMQLQLIENNIDNVKVKFTLGNALKNEKLMISDAICNMYLTRSAIFKNKGNEQIIKELIEKYKVITAIKTTKREDIMAYIKNKQYKEAILNYNLCSKTDINEVEDKIVEVLTNLESNTLLTVLNEVTATIESAVNIERDFQAMEKIIERLNTSFISKLKTNGVECEKFSMELKINFVSLYTHKGDINKAEKFINEAEVIATELKDRDKIYRLKNKLAVNYNNAFQFKEAIDLLDNHIKKMEEIKEFEALMNEMTFEDNTMENVNYSELGKALGTRLQSRVYLSRKDKNQLELALEDSKAALREFTNKGDYNRQLQYRAVIETECGNYEKAIEYLAESVVINEEATLKNLANKIKNSKERIPFSLMHYCRIMGEAALGGSKVAEEMFKYFNSDLNKLDIISKEVDDKSIKEHPVEILYWKIATYYAVNNTYKAAMTYYDKALKVLSYNNDDTRKVIELAILCEKGFFIEKAGKAYQGEVKKVHNILDKKIRSILEGETSEGIKEFVKDNFTEYKSDLLKASRTVGY